MRRPAVNKANLAAYLQDQIDRRQTSLVEMGFRRYPDTPLLQDALNGDSTKVIAASLAMQISALMATGEAFGLFLRLENAQ